MTKIKDLATISIDNSLRSFPLDRERYELVVALGRWIGPSGSYAPLFNTAPVLEDTRLMGWFLSTTANVHTAIVSKWKTDIMGQKTTVLEIDRVLRLDASLREVYSYDEVQWSNLSRFTEQYYRSFWTALLLKMVTTPGYLSMDLLYGQRSLQ